MSYKLLEGRPGLTGKIVPIVTGCLGGGTKPFKKDIRDFLIGKGRFEAVKEMQKILLQERESIARKFMCELIRWMF